MPSWKWRAFYLSLNVLKFQVIKNINDGTHSRCSGTHKDHGPWAPGTHKAVNKFDPLKDSPSFNITGKICICPIIFASMTLDHGYAMKYQHSLSTFDMCFRFVFSSCPSFRYAKTNRGMGPRRGYLLRTIVIFFIRRYKYCHCRCRS